jgi:hypothetical protein
MERRKFVKTIGTGITILSSGKAVAASNDGDSIDTGFDPSDKKETIQFLIDTFEKGENKSETEIQSLQTTIADELTEQQERSIMEALRENAMLSPSFNLNKNKTTNRQGEEEFESYDYTISTEIEIGYWVTVPFPKYVTRTFDAYEFTHTINWYYLEGEKVTSGYASCDGNGHIYPVVSWDYQGKASGQKRFHPDNLYVKTFREGKVKQKIVAKQIHSRTHNPSCWLQGDNHGYGSAYDIDRK